MFSSFAQIAARFLATSELGPETNTVKTVNTVKSKAKIFELKSEAKVVELEISEKSPTTYGSDQYDDLPEHEIPPFSLLNYTK